MEVAWIDRLHKPAAVPVLAHEFEGSSTVLGAMKFRGAELFLQNLDLVLHPEDGTEVICRLVAIPLLSGPSVHDVSIHIAAWFIHHVVVLRFYNLLELGVRAKSVLVFETHFLEFRHHLWLVVDFQLEQRLLQVLDLLMRLVVHVIPVRQSELRWFDSVQCGIKD